MSANPNATDPAATWKHDMTVDREHLDHAWRRLLEDTLEAMNQVPKKGNIWALLERNSKSGMQHQLVSTSMTNISDVDAAICTYLKINKDTQSFTVHKFFYHEVLIGVRITITAGENQGTHYLVSPNEFEDTINTKLQFMRAMDTASENNGAVLDKAEL